MMMNGTQVGGSILRCGRLRSNRIEIWLEEICIDIWEQSIVLLVVNHQ